MAAESSGTGPGFTSSRRQAGRTWSGLKQSPHAVRSSCGHGMIEPGAPHYVLTDPQRGRAVACGACYRADVAEAAPRPRRPEDGQLPEKVLAPSQTELVVPVQPPEAGGIDPDRREDWLTG